MLLHPFLESHGVCSQENVAREFGQILRLDGPGTVVSDKRTNIHSHRPRGWKTVCPAMNFVFVFRLRRLVPMEIVSRQSVAQEQRGDEA